MAATVGATAVDGVATAAHLPPPLSVGIAAEAAAPVAAPLVRRSTGQPAAVGPPAQSGPSACRSCIIQQQLQLSGAAVRLNSLSSHEKEAEPQPGCRKNNSLWKRLEGSPEVEVG